MSDSGKAVLPNIRRRKSSIIEYVRQRCCYKSRYIDFTTIGWNLMEKLFEFSSVITIRFNKHRPALYQSRLDKFIENTGKGIIYGD